MPTSSTTSAAWRRAEARLLAWFAAQERRAAPFQRAAWRAWHEGHNGLIHAPTGTGKTLAAAGGLTLRGTQRGIRVSRPGPDGQLVQTTPGLQAVLQPEDVVYVPESLF